MSHHETQKYHPIQMMIFDTFHCHFNDFIMSLLNEMSADSNQNGKYPLIMLPFAFSAYMLL